MAKKGQVRVGVRLESPEMISLYCSGKLIGWVSARSNKETVQMAKAVVVWYASEYDHDKHGAMMELRDGEESINNMLLKTGHVRKKRKSK